MTTNYTFDEIINKFQIKCDENIEKDLFVEIMNGNFNKQIDETIDPNILFNIGKYYHKIQKDYDMMKKYYLMAIEKGNHDAMNNLGLYYKNIEKDYDMMKKYYLMAIDKGCFNAMNNLGFYYYQTEKNYDLMQ